VLNNPPFIVGGSIDPFIGYEDYYIFVTLTDFEGDYEDGNSTLRWELVSYDSDIITFYEFRTDYDQFTFEPLENFSGTTNITVRVGDKDGNYSDEVTFDLVWQAVNDQIVVINASLGSTSVHRNHTMVSTPDSLMVYADIYDPDNNASLTNEPGNLENYTQFTGPTCPGNSLSWSIFLRW